MSNLRKTDLHSDFDGVGAKTQRGDNTRAQRIKALKVLTDQGMPLSEAVSLLGIDLEWLHAEGPESPSAAVSAPITGGRRFKRNHYNGPARL